MVTFEFPQWPTGKESACNPGATEGMGSIPGLERYPGGGHGKPLQCSCLENPKDRGVWHATFHRVAKSWTRLKRPSARACTHTHTHTHTHTLMEATGAAGNTTALRATHQQNISFSLIKQGCENFRLLLFWIFFPPVSFNTSNWAKIPC